MRPIEPRTKHYEYEAASIQRLRRRIVHDDDVELSLKQPMFDLIDKLHPMVLKIVSQRSAKEAVAKEKTLKKTKRSRSSPASSTT